MTDKWCSFPQLPVKITKYRQSQKTEFMCRHYQYIYKKKKNQNKIVDGRKVFWSTMENINLFVKIDGSFLFVFKTGFMISLKIGIDHWSIWRFRLHAEKKEERKEKLKTTRLRMQTNVKINEDNAFATY